MKMNRKLSFEAIAVLEDGIAYASSKEFNGLFQVNMHTGKCKYISLFPHENLNQTRLHCKVEFYHNKLFFVPSSAVYLSVFDLIEHKFHQIELPDLIIQNGFYKPYFKFIDSYVLDEYLWMIPSSYPAIFKVNLHTEAITVIDNWVPESGYFFRKGSYLSSSKIYVPDTTSNNILEIDTKLDIVKLYPVGENNKGCWSCNSDDAIDIWFAPRNPGPIFKWDKDRNNIVEFDNYPAGYRHNNFLFSKVYMINQNVYFIPAYGNMMMAIDRANGCMSSIYNEIFENAAYTEYLFETNAFLYINVVYADKVIGYKISKADNALTQEDFIISDGIDQRARDYIYFETSRNAVIKESKTFGLDDYIDGLLCQ